jgi:hypothetical protein
MRASAAPRPSRRASPTAPAGPLHRAGRALLGWWPRRRAEPAATRAEQLYALLAVLDEGVAAQSTADGVVAACGEPGPVSGSVARAAGEQISVYHKLNVRLRRLGVDDDLDELKQRAGRLLDYHQWILHQAVNLAGAAVHPDARVEAARQRLDGLGRPGDGLRNLREEVKDLAERARDREAATR